MSKKYIKSFLLNCDGNVVEEDNGIWCVVMFEGSSEESIELIDKTVIQQGQWYEDAAEDNLPDSDFNAGENATRDSAECVQMSIDNCNNSEGSSAGKERNGRLKWDVRETKFLLDMYTQYLPEVGPTKLFRDKKTMFSQIAKDFKEQLSFKCNGEQCFQRYATIMKKEKCSKENNKTSGNTRKTHGYEKEIEGLKAIDDSLEPEVRMGVGVSLVINKKKIKPDEHDQMLGARNQNEHLKENKRNLRKRTIVEVYEERDVIKENNREKWREKKYNLISEMIRSIRDEEAPKNKSSEAKAHCSRDEE